MQIDEKNLSQVERTSSRLLRGARAAAREPIVVFLIFGALFLGAYQVVAGHDAGPSEEIVVSAEQIEQFHNLLAQSLQRPPTEQEVKFAIDDFVKEEIYYREAKKLGLDQDDTVIRRRLRQKMEFLGDVAAEQIKPTDAELQSYLAANKEKFAGEPSFAFQQVFLSADRRGGADCGDADAALRSLQGNPDLPIAGDPSSLPPDMPLTGISDISAIFGGEFAAALQGLKPGIWAGPVTTPFGLHLVRVIERKEGTAPDLASVRADVEREWAYARRQELEEARFAEYLKTYKVRIMISKQDGQP